MNILIVSAYPPSQGGVPNHIYNIVQHIKREHQITLITDRGAAPTEEGLRIIRLSPHHAGYVSSFFFNVFACLAMLPHLKHADIVHIQFLNFFSALLPVIPRLFGRPSVVTVHGLAGWKYWDYRLLRSVTVASLRAANAIITVSKANKILLQQCSLGRVDHVANGFDRSIFFPRDMEEKHDILFFGRLHKQKGLVHLLEAFSEMRQKSATLCIIGGGDEEQRLRKQAETIGILGRVAFLGYMQPAQLAENIRMAKLVVLPSLFEGFPLALIEAMACGRAVITTRTEGVADFVEDGVNAVLVAPGVAGELRVRMEDLLENDQARRKIGLNAARAVASKYDWGLIAEETEEVYGRNARAKDQRSDVGIRR